MFDQNREFRKIAKQAKSRLIKAFLLAFVLLTGSCSGGDKVSALSSQLVLIGSTPGGEAVKSMLAISADKPIDFIRWELALNPETGSAGTYVLNLAFGEGQPNTSGFKNGGEKLSLQGSYRISRSPRGEIYELTDGQTQAMIRLARLNDNLFHLLTAERRMMVGTGGWSYTLSRKDAAANAAEPFAFPMSPPPDKPSGQEVFDGRTPCSDFARLYELRAGGDCLKLKWRLTLIRDAATGAPAAYTLQSTLNRPNAIEGKWTIVKGIKNNPEAIVYRLDAEKPEQSLSFLVGDENVLFFLDRQDRLLTGNADFSFTLNRRKN